MKTPLLIALIVIVGLLLILILAARIRNIRDRISSMPPLAAIIISLILAAALVFLLIRLLAPAGQDSLFSKAPEGNASGEAVSDTQLPEAEHGTGTGNRTSAAESAVSEELTITISGDRIRLDAQEPENVEELAALLESRSGQIAGITLVDDYAQASVLKAAGELLSRLELSYTLKTIN